MHWISRSFAGVGFGSLAAALFAPTFASGGVSAHPPSDPSAGHEVAALCSIRFLMLSKMKSGFRPSTNVN